MPVVQPGCGSAASRVAPAVFSLVLKGRVVMACAAAKASFVGGAAEGAPTRCGVVVDDKGWNRLDACVRAVRPCAVTSERGKTGARARSVRARTSRGRRRCWRFITTFLPFGIDQRVYRRMSATNGVHNYLLATSSVARLA